MYTQRAFSLLELLITLSLLAIAASLVVPGLTSFTHHTMDEWLQAQLLHTIEFAHTEAFLRHVPIGVCGQEGKGCGENWAQGQLVFTDENEDGKILTQDQILLVMQTHVPTGAIYWRSFPVYRHYLQFSPSGDLLSDNGTFWFCADKAKLPTWAIMLSKSGRARKAYPNQQGEIKDAKGLPLPCN